jgi:hypothetical protein
MSLLAATNPQKKKTTTNVINGALALFFDELIFDLVG